VTLGDRDFRKSLVKMIYRKLTQTESLPVTHFILAGFSLSEWDDEDDKNA
jgi:hypothetical protein